MCPSGNDDPQKCIEFADQLGKGAAFPFSFSVIDAYEAHINTNVIGFFLHLLNFVCFPSQLLLLQLWGKAEQTKLLKLLIALEEFDMAAEGFAVTKV